MKVLVTTYTKLLLSSQANISVTTNLPLVRARVVPSCSLFVIVTCLYDPAELSCSCDNISKNLEPSLENLGGVNNSNQPFDSLRLFT